jgi:hypothetical protein
MHRVDRVAGLEPFCAGWTAGLIAAQKKVRIASTTR